MLLFMVNGDGSGIVYCVDISVSNIILLPLTAMCINMCMQHDSKQKSRTKYASFTSTAKNVADF